MCSFLQDLFVGTINFGHVTLTVTFDLHLDKFNSPQNFLTIRHRTFIFGVCVPYINTSGGNISFDQKTFILKFDLLSKNFKMTPIFFYRKRHGYQISIVVINLEHVTFYLIFENQTVFITLFITFILY